MAKSSLLFQGFFQHIVYSPKGDFEGALLMVDGNPMQVVFDKHDAESGQAFSALRAGQKVAVSAYPTEPSSKGFGAHPVFAFSKLESVDGVKPAKKRKRAEADYSGTVTRLNYARHGAANGVVLDTGDFIHLKPEGFEAADLKLGDQITADGDAHLLATGRGWAVEATHVNGKPVKRK